MIKQKRGIKDNLIAVVLALVCLIAPMLNLVTPQVYADEITYSYVMDDLSKDKDFNVADYPAVSDDYSIKVIQVAESNNKELFVYIYQPLERLRATRVSMSLGAAENYILYDLTLINSSGVFFKYKLTNFTVSDEETRYYNIASIYREWDEDLDGKSSTEIEKAFKVGHIMTAKGFGENATFEYQNVEVVEISQKIAANVASVSVSSPWNWMTAGENGFCSHVVAFSTNLPIDTIFEAEVYATYHYEKVVVDYDPGYSIPGYKPPDVINEGYVEYVPLKYDEVASVSKKGKTYTFNRIMRTSDYLETLGDEIVVDNDFSSLDWVLCVSEPADFFYYEYYGATGYHYTQVGGTYMDAASILKLKFDMGGMTYEMGVVDNISKSEDYVKRESKGWPWWVYLILAILACIILAPIIALLKPVWVLLWKIIQKILEGIWWLITLPYQIIKKRKG